MTTRALARGRRAARGLQRARARLCAGAILLAGPLAAQERVTARFEVPSRAAVDSVRRLGVDVVEARPLADGRVDLVAVISPRDRGLLAASGWVPEEVPRAPGAALMESRRLVLGARAFTVYRDFDDPSRGVAAYLRALAAARTNLTVDSIGASVEGRPVLAVKVGAATDAPSRPNVIYVATYHAREWVAAEVALRLVTFLADSLPLRPGGAALLAARDVWVIPVANPDGYEYTFTTTRLWRKNRRPNGNGVFGIDLNRNHTTFFALDDAGSSPDPASDVYRGAAAESEPETRAIAAFFRAHPPAVSITYHTYTGAILYPWGQRDGLLTGDDGIFRVLAGTDVAPAMRDSVPGSINDRYHPGPGWNLYPTNGDFADWAYQEFGAAAFTVELTSGCCAGGAYYGFEFPDDELLLARVTRDALPFALGLLQAAADLPAAVGPAGAVAGAGFESVWPLVRVLAPRTAGTPSLQIATDSGRIESRPLTAEPLGNGVSFARYVSDSLAVRDARAVRVASLGLTADILARDGAENPASPWTGFTRTNDAFEGGSAWTGNTGALTSPDIPVGGRSGITLFFWTKYAGSLFDQGLRGRVEISTDGGATWTEVARVIGAAPVWYPVAVPLTGAAGASTLRVRFTAERLSWTIDAIAVTAGQTSLFDVSSVAAAPGAAVAFSANPVRTPPVFIRWPAVGTGGARVDVYSLLGTRVMTQSFTTDPGLFQWDTESAAGAPVANGVYMVVVARGDGSRLRRRLFIARGP